MRPCAVLGLALGAAGCSDAARGSPGPCSAVLITLDTTRADALGCLGRAPSVTPRLDRLAEKSRVFAAAYSVAPITLPAHASMLTGLYPPRHTLRENGLWALPDEATTLAERAGAAGIDTGAFIASIVLDGRYGLDQGFATFSVPRPDGAGESSHFSERRAAAVVDDALAWLAQRRPRERRFFLWVHLFDPHQPYAPPPELARRTGDPYLGEVAAMDREIGRLLDALDLERTVVLAVGDHGESLGEHGEKTHGVFCYEATLRVPWILQVPGDPRAGTRSSAIVSVVDVAPTLAEALGLAAGQEGADGDGSSLLRDDPPPGRGVYFESYSGYLSFGWSPLAGWRDARGKYMHSAAPELHDPASDPREERNLLAERAGEVARYRDAIAAVFERPMLAATDARQDRSRAEELRALGYAGGGEGVEGLPHPLADSGLPAPRTRRDALNETLDALALFNDGSGGGVARAREKLEAVLDENPGNWVALDTWAHCLMREGREVEAIDPWTRIVAARPRWGAAWFNLGVCLRAAGRDEEAVPALWTAAELEPASPRPLEELLDVLRALRRRDELLRAAERLRALRER